MMQAMCSSETSVLTRATRRNIPEDGFLYSGYFIMFAFRNDKCLGPENDRCTDGACTGAAGAL
jgi:hypothetical protein